MLDLPADLPRRYRYQLRVYLWAGLRRYSYELVGAKGGVHLHVSGPHRYNDSDHWSAGFEVHRRSSPNADEPPSHDDCWLLKCPCWHDGTSLYAEEYYLPLVRAGQHAAVFRSLIRDADKQLGEESAP